jgi:hypothetical protein
MRGELGEKHREAIPSYFSTIITNFQKYRYFSLPSIFYYVSLKANALRMEWKDFGYPTYLVKLLNTELHTAKAKPSQTTKQLSP